MVTNFKKKLRPRSCPKLAHDTYQILFLHQQRPSSVINVFPYFGIKVLNLDMLYMTHYGIQLPNFIKTY
jgi:hypothetical protein